MPEKTELLVANIRAYYRGEQYAGLSYVLLALLNSLAIFMLYRYSGEARQSIIITIAIFALLQATVGIYAYRDARRRMVAKQQTARQSPVDFVKNEQRELAGTKRTFQRIILVFAVIIGIAAIGLLYAYGQKVLWLVNVTLVVVVELSLMIVSDVLAKRRLIVYDQKLADFLSTFPGAR